MAPDQKKKLIIVLVLLGVLAAAWYLVLLGPLSASKAGPRREVVVTQAPEEGAGSGTQGEEAAKIPTADEVDGLLRDVTAFLGSRPQSVPEGLRDPFAVAEAAGTGPEAAQATPPAKPKEQPVLRFNVSAILWDAKGPMAVINRRVVKEGDLVGTGITLSKIEPTSVTISFRYWGRQNNVSLPLEPR